METAPARVVNGLVGAIVAVPEVVKVVPPLDVVLENGPLIDVGDGGGEEVLVHLRGAEGTADPGEDWHFVQGARLAGACAATFLLGASGYYMILQPTGGRMERTWSCFDCQFEDTEPLCFTADGVFDPKRLACILLKVPAADVPHEEKGERMRAYDCVDEMVQSTPEAAVAFILAAIDECRTGEHVALLGAGALETLLKAHGPEVIAPLEQEARAHAKVRYLLSAIWSEDSIVPGVWQRLKAAVAPGPVMDADARTPAAGMADKILDADGVAKLLGKPMT